MTKPLKTQLAALGLVASLASVSVAAFDADFSAAGPAARAAIETAKTQDSVSVAATSVRPLGAESVVRDQTSVVPVDLNTKTVKCSAADYQAPMLKILVPALAELTVLNHRNTREGAPCVAAGRCMPGGAGPDDILKAGEGREKIAVRVVLKKTAELDGEVCRVTLVETVSTKVRGVPFFHERRQEVAERSPADCR
ncbi:MAG: hypothetical protein HY077_00135 [Elusimicrobia bacterium]|nr:hypothetical protein [Elusimicrobiota bacterium]